MQCKNHLRVCLLSISLLFFYVSVSCYITLCVPHHTRPSPCCDEGVAAAGTTDDTSFSSSPSSTSSKCSCGSGSTPPPPLPPPPPATAGEDEADRCDDDGGRGARASIPPARRLPPLSRLGVSTTPASLPTAPPGAGLALPMVAAADASAAAFCTDPPAAAPPPPPKERTRSEMRKTTPRSQSQGLGNTCCKGRGASVVK